MKKKLPLFIGSCLLLAPLVLFLFAGTATGLQALLWMGNRLAAPLVHIGSASGSLFGTLHLRDVRYADGIDTVVVDLLEVSWDPAQLIEGHVHLTHVRGVGIRVLLGESSYETVLLPFALPGRWSIDRVAAEALSFLSEHKEVWRLDSGFVTGLVYRGHTLHVEEISLASETLALQAKGQLLTKDDYPLRLAFASHIRPQGFESMHIRGTTKGALNALSIEADALSPFPAHLQGRLNGLLGATTWQATLESPEIVLSKIHKNWPEQRFAKVGVNGQGTLDTYTLHVHSLAGLPQVPNPSELSVEIQGDGDGINIDTLHLAQGRSELSAKGRLAWNPSLSWQGEVNGSHLDPSLFLAAWPGDFTGRLTTSGQLGPHGLDASLHLPTLQGTLRGFPVAGNGELHVRGDRLEIPQLLIKSGTSSLRIQGKAAESVDLSLQLDSSNLAELWPGTRGKVNAHGRIMGPTDKPRLDFKLSAHDVGSGNHGVQKLTADANGILTGDGQFDAALRAEQVRIRDIRVDRGLLRFKGSLPDHRIEFTAQSSDFSAGVVLQGALSDGLWQGALSQGRYASQHFGPWRQGQDTPLTLSPEKAEMQQLCLVASASGALCVNGVWDVPGNTWQLQATAKEIPLQLLQAIATLNQPLVGRINAGVELTGNRSRIVSGKISINADTMSMSLPLPGGGTHPVVWRKNNLSATYENNRLQAVLESEFADSSTVQAELAVTDFPFPSGSLARAPLSGSIRFRLQDLSPLALLTDQKVFLSGVLQGRYTLGGSLASPLLHGQMELANGQAEIPPLGITLSPLIVKMTSDTKGVQLVATAHSGPGNLRAESSIPFDRLLSGPYPIRLTGDSFRAAHLPGLDLALSPDLHLAYGDRQTTVQGTVTVTSAKITSIDFQTATPVSGDMVVVDDEHIAVSETPTVPLLVDVTAIAREDVHVDAYGLRGNIVGELTIKSQPGRPPIGNGTLSVRNGSFTVYGKRLIIDIGRLLFTGGPLTNPGIELRSERKGEKISTGVLVDGFLQRPEMHFFSSPAMEQSAIVTHLLESTAIGGETRQDAGFIGEAATKVGLASMVPYFQNVKKLTMIDEIKLESGDDYDSFSLVFGSWLTPDFYISYGKDLVKESGTFNTRYILGKGFSFLTETGSSHSGGDIKYEFEH